MGRGKHLSTKAKEMRGLMQAMMVGLSKGEITAAKKKYTLKNLPYIMVHKFDEMKSDQIFKFISILGVTVIIKSGIEWSESILATFTGFIYWILGQPADMSTLEEALDKPEAEIIQWVLSFAVAYLIVENFGELVTAGTNILSLANTMIGAAAMAAG